MTVVGLTAGKQNKWYVHCTILVKCFPVRWVKTMILLTTSYNYYPDPTVWLSETTLPRGWWTALLSPASQLEVRDISAVSPQLRSWKYWMDWFWHSTYPYLSHSIIHMEMSCGVWDALCDRSFPESDLCQLKFSLFVSDAKWQSRSFNTIISI